MKKPRIQKKGIIMFMPVIGIGGVEKNLFQITNYLATKIKNVKVCTTTKNISRKFDKNTKIISDKFKNLEKINIRLRYLICLFTLYNFLKKNNDYIVLAFQANIYCVLVCKLLNIDIIVRSNTSPAGWRHNSIKEFIYKKIIKNTNVFLVNSIEFQKQIQKKYNINVKCILNPLNTTQILKNLELKKSTNTFFKKGNKSLKLINIGRLTDQKDQMTILKAVNLLKNKINFELLIVGNGYEKKKLLNYINNNDLKKFVKILDFTKYHYSILNEAEVFILSSIYEGLPNVLLEAAYLKKFIISTDCPTGPKEILQNGKGGFLFKVYNYEELAKKIFLYNKQKKILRKKVHITYKGLGRYNYNKNLEKYYLMIKNLIC